MIATIRERITRRDGSVLENVSRHNVVTGTVGDEFDKYPTLNSLTYTFGDDHIALTYEREVSA